MLALLLGFAPRPKKPLSPEPVLGYNTWNAFTGDINEEKIRRTADLMVEKGLLAAGYEYLVIDDGYLLRERGPDGRIIIDSAKFPGGMKAVADYVHSKGLKFGMYNCAGTYTCMGLAGSFGHEQIDAETFAGFGADFLKYDYCYNPVSGQFYTPDLFSITVGGQHLDGSSAILVGGAKLKGERQVAYIGNGDGEAVFTVTAANEGVYELEVEYATDSYRIMLLQVNDQDSQVFLGRNTGGFDAAHTLVEKLNISLRKGGNTIRFFMDLDNPGIAHYSYMRMGDALIGVGRDITFAVCEWGSNQPYKWAQDVGHLWRTSYDITGVSGTCNWNKIVENYETAVGLYDFSWENAYNDPDMLCVGLNGINHDENQAHISLWSIMNSPLQIGADLDKIEDQYVEMLKNEHMLRINQDKLHVQAMPILRADGHDILLKPLDDGSVAFLFFNKLNEQQTISFDLNELHNWFNLTQFENNSDYRCMNIWNGNTFDVPRVMPRLVDEVPAHGVFFYMIKPVGDAI